MNFRPLNKNVIIVEEKIESKTGSGIILSQSTETPMYKVIAVGEYVEFVKVGNMIVVGLDKAKKVRLGGKDNIMVSEESIIAIVES